MMNLKSAFVRFTFFTLYEINEAFTELLSVCANF